MSFLCPTFTVRTSHDAPQETVEGQLARQSLAFSVTPMRPKSAVKRHHDLCRVAEPDEAREGTQPLALPTGCQLSQGRDGLETQACVSDARGSLLR